MASSDRAAKRRRGIIYLVVIGGVSLLAVGGLIALQPFGGPLDWFIRAAALLGYWFIFLAVVSSNYMREMFMAFGRPFIKVHHTVSVAGLVLVTLHPLAVAVRSSQPSVFVPVISSLGAFLRLGGRPALYLIGLAALAGLLRTRYRKRWRIVHFLNYVGFLLATAHGVMIGTDFVSPVTSGIAILLAVLVIAVFARKRIQRYRLTHRKK